MNLRDKKGSISIFVLVALLFMASVLLLMFASSINKSKVVKEQFNTISGIYAYSGGDEGAYDKSYTELRQKNKRIFSFENAADANKTIFKNTSTIKLTKTFDGNMSNYRIYGNSVQDGTPSPTNPVEIKSVGNKIVNLINEKSVFAYKNIYFGVTKSNGYNTFEAGTYTFSVVCSDGGKTNLYILDAADSSQILVRYGVDKITFTLAEKKNIIIKAYDNRFTSIDDIISFQLQKGEIATEHEPYGDKYKIKVRAIGKNLLNINELLNDFCIKNNDGSITFKITESGNRYSKSAHISLKAGTSYHMSAVSNNSDYIMAQLSSITGKNYYWNLAGSDDSMTFSEDIVSIRFYFNQGYTESLTINKLQIEEGNKYTEYVPYQEEQSFNLYLDEPLRKVGNVADYIDYTNGKILRKIGVIESYNGETISEQYISDTGDLSIGTTVYYQLPEESCYGEVLSLPNLKTFEDYTKIEVLTEVEPSKIEVKYVGYTLD